MSWRARQATILAARLALIAGGSCLALLLVEMALRLMPSANRYAVWLPYTVRRSLPNPEVFPGITGIAQFTTSSQGIRGRELGENAREYRLLALGGSTTEGLAVDDREVWTALLEQELGPTADGRATWVGNVGRSGMNSRDHVVQLDGLSLQYPEIETFLVLVGVNDLTVALAKGDRYVPPAPLHDPTVRSAMMERVFAAAPRQFINYPRDDPDSPRPWRYTDTAVWRLMRRAWRAISLKVGGAALEQDVKGRNLTRWRRLRQAAPQRLATLPDLSAALTEYRGNLRAMADLAAERGRRIVFMTQPTIWRTGLPQPAADRCWLGGTGDFQVVPAQAYYSIEALAAAMHRFNEVVLEVGRERSVEVIDLATRLPKDESVFFDDVHFTERGERLVAAEIARYLKERSPYARN